MTVLPVIERELRAQSRLTFTYGLRVTGVIAVLAVCVLYSFSHPLSPGTGGALFSLLNITIFFSIWILGPMLCADCISRERREGTMGLLFLTPLSTRAVVMAKGVVHGLRAVSLLLAVLPVITIALLLGGVGWTDAAMSLIMNFSALCWALGAGLLASAFSKRWLRALLLAFILAGGCGAAFLMMAGMNTFVASGGTAWFPYVTVNEYDRALAAGFVTATDYEQSWGEMLARMPAAAQTTWVLAEGRMIIFSLLFLFIVIEIAQWNLRRTWREEPPSARQVWLEKKLFTPVLAVSFLRRWMQHKLERNPIGWLEHRTWSGRAVTWGWFAVMISFYSAALSSSDVYRSRDAMQAFMAWLLLGIIAVSAAGSFQRERETGLLELLLISPMSVAQIIGGRLRGLWGQFLPAFAVLLGIWALLASFFPSGPRWRESWLIEFFCGAFVTLPVIGLFYSLRRTNFISAFLSTVFMGLAVPYGLKAIVNLGIQFVLGMNAIYVMDIGQPRMDDSLGTLVLYALLRLTASPFFVTLIQLSVAIWLGRRLYRDMVNRNFIFSRTTV